MTIGVPPKYLSAAHFGKSGVMRWAIFGTMYAILIRVHTFIPPSNWFILDRMLEGIVQAMAVGGAYYLAFKLFGQNRQQQSLPPARSLS